MDTLISCRKEIRLKGKPFVTKEYLPLNPYVPVFEFSEGEDISFTFTFNTDIVQIFFQNRKGEMEQIVSEEKISFSKQEENGYAPGTFPFQVLYRGNLNEYTFLVKPSQLDFAHVQQMRDSVNGFCKGASLNPYASQETKEGDMDELSALLDILPSVSQMAQLYFQKGYTEVHKKPKISHSSKKISKKSIDWLAKKGLGLSGSLDTLLIEKADFTLDNDQNRLFKEILLYWDGLLVKQIQKLQVSYVDIQQDISDKNELLEDIYKKEISVGESQYINEYSIKKEQKQIYYVSKDKKKKEGLLERNKDVLNSLQKYKSIFEKMLYHSWLQDVSVNKQAHIIPMEQHLRVLLDLNKRYENSLQTKQKRQFFLEKSTYQLFETYTYILLLKLVKKHGFSIVESGNLLYDLSNESRIVLKKENVYCSIVYDQELKKGRYASNNTFCTINSTHNKPDFILSFYHENEVPFLSFIVENKWISGSHIYSSKIETETEVTLYDYLQLGYKSTRLHRGVIQQVLCLYPDSKENELTISDDIFAIGIKPQQNMSKSLGYKNLEQHIFTALEAIQSK